MIYLEIQGNLGNQLFQYAFAKKIATIVNQDICLNLYNFNKNRPDLVFSLNEYKLIDNVTLQRDKKLPFYANSYSIFSRIMKKIAPNIHSRILKKIGVFFWQGEDIRLDLLDNIPNRKNYYIAGWFQSADYFNDIRNALLKDLEPKNCRKEENKSLYEAIENSESVCVSIRRGDYVTNPKFNKMYYICDSSYFQKAMDKICQMIETPTFVFFSDDIQWVKDNVISPEKVYYESGKDSTCEKLRLMASCKHFIVSNSSFSWWAQYLGKENGSVVVAPSRWSVKETKPSAIYQNDWNLIDV